MDKTPAQRLKPIITHQMHWELIDSYLAGEKACLVKRLLQCTPEELPKLQGQIMALTKLQEMPQTLKSEMSA